MVTEKPGNHFLFSCQIIPHQCQNNHEGYEPELIHYSVRKHHEGVCGSYVKFQWRQDFSVWVRSFIMKRRFWD